MAKLFVFRHGESTFNRDNLLTGWLDPGITEKGFEQAKEIRDSLKDEKITKAYTSDMQRTQKTLEIVLNGRESVPILIDKRLRERSYGDLAGQSKQELAQKYPEDYPKWHRSYDVAPPNGESLKDVWERVVSFLNEILPSLDKDDVVLICSHGNTIRAIRKYFEKLSTDEMTSFEHTPAKVYSYEV